MNGQKNCRLFLMAVNKTDAGPSKDGPALKRVGRKEHWAWRIDQLMGGTDHPGNCLNLKSDLLNRNLMNGNHFTGTRQTERIGYFSVRMNLSFFCQTDWFDCPSVNTIPVNR
jgi:hypothetical protein